MVSGEFETTKYYEDENMIIIKDINPIAPIHYLLIVKDHYALIADQNENQSKILGECLYKLSLIKNDLGLTNGYRLVINQGEDAGQTVKHLHVHILGGKELNWDKLINKELTPPYVPKVKSNSDISNFSSYPDSDVPAQAIKKSEDPFIDWFN